MQYHHEQPLLTEEEIIHTFLAFVITKLPGNRLSELVDPGDVFIGINQDQFMTLTMHRMVAEGLITTEKSRRGRLSHFARVTPQGIRIAQSPGGYRSYAAVQRNTAAQEFQTKLETDHLNRRVAKANIDTVELARIANNVSQRSLRMSKVAIIISSLIALAAMVAQVVPSSDTATELALAKRQIKELQEQVKMLNSHTK